MHEARITIPAIKTFIREHGLKFIGFEFDQPILQRHLAEFFARGWSLTDFDRWHTEDLTLPAGVTTVPFQSTVTPRKPVAATAAFGPKGLSGTVVGAAGGVLQGGLDINEGIQDGNNLQIAKGAVGIATSVGGAVASLMGAGPVGAVIGGLGFVASTVFDLVDDSEHQISECNIDKQDFTPPEAPPPPPPPPVKTEEQKTPEEQAQEENLLAFAAPG